MASTVRGQVPDELLLHIALQVEGLATLNALAVCNSRFNAIFEPELYSRCNRPNDNLDIIWAAKNDCIGTVKRRLRYGLPWADDTLNKFADCRRHGILDLLLDSSPELLKRVNNEYAKFTPLYRACSSGSLDTVKVLIRHGAQVQTRPSWKGPGVRVAHRSAFHLAIQKGYVGILHELLDRGGAVIAAPGVDNPDFFRMPGKYQLPDVWLAVDADQCDSLRVLLSHGADPDARCPLGETALWCAGWERRVDCFELLLDHGANPLLAPYNYEISTMEVFASRGCLAIVRLLLPRIAHADGDFRMRLGALRHALRHERTGVVDYLTQHLREMGVETAVLPAPSSPAPFD